MICVTKDYKDFANYNSTMLANCNELSINIGFIEYGTDNPILSFIECPFDTPFICHPLLDCGGVKYIVYNPKVIALLNLTIEEQYACIFHEIGHFIANKKNITSKVEEYCDEIALKMGLGIEMLSSLRKMSETPDIYNEEMTTRILNLASKIPFFRPEWTSGRFNPDKKIAIFYNLIEGMSHLFEDESALVISNILKTERNNSFFISTIAKDTGIDVISIYDFLIELKSLGLVSDHKFSPEEIKEYRNDVVLYRRKEVKHNNYWKSSDSSLEINFDDAEMEYSNSVGGITSAMFELTYRCSEACIHCYNIGSSHNEKEQSKRHMREELTVDQYKSIIDQFYELGLFRVCLTGGDPFSYEKVWDVIEYLYKKNIVFDIYTNGQLLYGHEELLANYYPKIVGISIYSGIDRIHDSITRVDGSFKKSIAVMERLSNLAIPLYLKCCVIKTNFSSYDSVFEIADRFLAFPQIEVCVTDTVDGNKYVSQNLRLSEDQYNTILQDKRVPLYVGNDGTMKTIMHRDKNKNLCSAGIHTFDLTPEGNLVPCCKLQLIIGNVKNQKISEMIKKSQILKKWLNLTLKEYTECGRNHYCDYCNACPGLNFSEHGTPIEPAENACFVAKIRYGLAIKLGIITDKNDVRF